MSWTEQEWDGFCTLIEEAWPHEFDATKRATWRILLDGLEPAQAALGLRRLLHEGRRNRPSASELLAAARVDPSVPTYSEAFTLIFGTGGILAARPTAAERAEAGSLLEAHDLAARRVMAAMHPAVVAFVERRGLQALRDLGVDSSEYAQIRRRDLKHDWNEHLEARERREVAALASGRGAGELAQLDPLKALGIQPPAQITEEAAA